MTHAIRPGRPTLALCLALLALVAVGHPLAQPVVPLERLLNDGVTATRSARNINYDIDVALDPAARLLTGSETITWRNTGVVAAYSIRLHLYWNAFSTTDSTWLKQRALAGDTSFQQRPESDFGYTEVTGLEVVAADGTVVENLMPAFRYISPSDRNANDRSLAAAQMTKAVEPDETLHLRVRWRGRFPRNFDRTGAINDYFVAAQWFPKLGMFEPGGWMAHQSFANAGGYSDFGRYDVRITVPSGWTVGATGAEQARTAAGANAVHRYVQDDVNDFAWTTSPAFVEQRQRFEHPGIPGVEMRLLLQPEHAQQADRFFAATAATLRYFGEWFGRYPYQQITIVDPAYQSTSAGESYPTFFVAGTRWLAPAGSNQPEAAAIRGAGRQFWQSVVATNQVDHEWLSQGLTQYAQARAQSVAFESNLLVERFFGGLIPWQFRDIPLTRATDLNGMNAYRLLGDHDALATPTQLMFAGSQQAVSTHKTALMLHTLERQLGWDTTRRVFATYFDRGRFRHPTPEDFFDAVTQVSGQNMQGFFDQFFRSSNRFDYAIERFETGPITSRGLTNGPAGQAFQEQTTPGMYRTTVVARRLEAGQYPVEVLVTFANGEQARERWDGLARWQDFTFDRPVPAVSVQVDPERVLLLDTNYTNNSRLIAPANEAAATKWSLRWMVWLQDALMTYAFFV